MRLMILGLALTVALAFSAEAKASIVFETESTARQTITSPLFGGAVVISAQGRQTFTIDTVANTASVTSLFTGTDLPDPLSPGGFLSYSLYNTFTTGTATINGFGTYDISLSILFELKITSGVLNGFIFETLTNSIFAASNIATLPFPVDTVFKDPGVNDTTAVFVQFDPTGTFPTGTLIGTSSERTVTINSVVPEPASLAMGLQALLLTGYLARRIRNKASH